MKRLIALVIFASCPVAAQDAAPDSSVRPVARASGEAAETVVEPAPAEPAGADTAPVSPVAPQEPAKPSEPTSPDGPSAPASPAEPAVPEEPAEPSVLAKPAEPAIGQRDALRSDDAGYAACLMALDDFGTAYRETEAIIPDDDLDCGVLRPLTITEILPGIALSPAATMRCETAQALATWTQEFAIPASRRLIDRGALNAIETGSGYICRRRNNQPDGKLSEHAFGNAVDIMGFTFADGPPIKIEPREADGTLAEAFQDAVRAAACLDFATVLGPGSDAFHSDHLHLDIKVRAGGYRLCEQGGVVED